MFSLPNSVTLSTVAVDPPTVDAAGVTISPSQDSVSVNLTNAAIDIILGRTFTSGVRIRLLPGIGGAGRGAIRTTDQIVVRATARIGLRSGGATP